MRCWVLTDEWPDPDSEGTMVEIMGVTFDEEESNRWEIQAGHYAHEHEIDLDKCPGVKYTALASASPNI